jgi:hypothetical protein
VQPRQVVLGAEGIDVEGEGGGGGHASGQGQANDVNCAHRRNLLTVAAWAFLKVRRVAISPE